MRLGGLQKCSLIDFPGKITAILFTVGCNFRCPYCHNPELVDETSEIISVDNVFAFLTRRREILDAVTITGGEPTIQTDLVPFIRKVKEMGFLVKLDTNGTHPEVIELVQEEKLVDYIAMDIKAPLGRYASSVARPVDEVQIKKSIQLLIKGNIPYEFRTTVVKSLLSYDDLHEIGKTIKNAERYYLQKFVPTKTLNPAFVRKTTYTDTEFSEMQRFMETYVKLCGIR
jgi:pyruvate formate lyase activating enzyme